VTIRLGERFFLLVVNDDHASILHRYGNTGLQKFWNHEFDLLGSSDVIGHLAIGLGICGFLLAVNWNHASILHRYKDIWIQKYWGHDFDFLRSRDVIGHVINGLDVGTFLLVVNDDQKFWGHEFDLLGLRDVIIGLGTYGFLLVVHWNQASILHCYGDIKPQSCICPC